MVPLSRHNNHSNQQGFLMIELLVSIVIASMILGAFITLVTHSVKASTAISQELAAELLLREEIEVTKDLEHSNWAVLSTSCPCRVVANLTTHTWSLQGGNETVTMGALTFTRWLDISTVDASTKLVTATVQWGNHTRTLKTYVYNTP